MITTAVITTHHEIALRFRLKLRHFVICAVVYAAVSTAAFFKNAGKDSLPMPRQYKQIHFVFGDIYIYIRALAMDLTPSL